MFALFVLILLLILTFYNVYMLDDIDFSKYSEKAVYDYIYTLPGVTTRLLSKQFSGYLNISDTKFIHYYFIESESNPSIDPVILWTNGGPGCSGYYGMYAEMGPWKPQSDGTLARNPFSWTKSASMLFIEQPIGVGFSYTTDDSELNYLGDNQCSHDNLAVLHSFYYYYPSYKSNDLYIASESYGGHYIPQLTLQIFNDKEIIKRFKGYLLGNPYVSYSSSTIAEVITAWGLQLLPKSLWDQFKKYGCDDLSQSPYFYAKECWDILNSEELALAGINPYSLNYPVCKFGNPLNIRRFTSQQHTMKKYHNKISQIVNKRDNNMYNLQTQSVESSRRLSSSESYDPCIAFYMTDYLNRNDVQQALHVNQRNNSVVHWQQCSDVVFKNWPDMDFTADTISLYSTIYNHPNKPLNFKMLVFSGNSDGVCGTVGTQHWIYNIDNSLVKSLWKPWKVNNQLAGYVTIFTNNLVFVTVHNAGHEVPTYQPYNSLVLLLSYLDNSLFKIPQPILVEDIDNSLYDNIISVLIVFSVVLAICAILIGWIIILRQYIVRKL